MPTPLKLLAAAVAALVLMPASAPAQVKLDRHGAIPLPPDSKPPAQGPTLLPPTPVVVSMGDSAISGEGGRWAGNTKLLTGPADALGPNAYNDAPSGTAEVAPGCHRSKSAEVHISGDSNGSTVNSVNLACSGAVTGSRIDGRTGNFKPGLDFDNNGAGQKGQALQLQEYAAAHPHAVKAVVVLIGANDYGFSQVASTCITKWAGSFFNVFDHDVCADEPNMVSMFSATNIANRTNDIKLAYQRVHMAMTNAGYADSEYRIIAQTYTSPIPPGAIFRYGERDASRQLIGGCGVWNSDADWVQSTVIPTFNNSIRNAVAQSGLTNVDVLEAVDAFVGHRLCENTAGLLEERGVGNWQDTGASDKAEWVKQVNDYLPSNQSFFEGAHPNYWGQMALRNCFRQAYNNGSPHGGTCVHGANTGLNSVGEPRMTLQ